MRNKAPAKINLFLHITGKRKNGYHELESLMVPLQLADDIVIEKAKDTSLKIEGEFAIGLTGNNLITKTLESLRQYTGRDDLHAHITLVKHIPVGAGLGGGSSDAATVFKVMNDIYDLGLSEAELVALATPLGADIPFFINNTPAMIRGIGEEITPVNLPGSLPLLLVFPRKPLPTAAVFTHHPLPISAPLLIKEEELLARLADTDNSLTDNAIMLQPEISDVLLALRALEGVYMARMSGSGSTCFALFKDDVSLDNAFKRITENYPHWWCKKQNTMDNH